jgi:hypothetical protein
VIFINHLCKRWHHTAHCAVTLGLIQDNEQLAKMLHGEKNFKRAQEHEQERGFPLKRAEHYVDLGLGRCRYQAGTKQEKAAKKG